jgi:hypothetical protein
METKPGNGMFFTNPSPAGGQPNMQGKVVAHRNIRAGEELQIAGWWKKQGTEYKVDKNGQVYMGLKISDPYQKRTNAVAGPPQPPQPAVPQVTPAAGPPQAAQSHQNVGEPFDDDIPF